MNKNDQITLQITAVSSDGNGIGKHEGMAVFVPLTAVGDTAIVRIVKVKKSYAFGKLIELLTPSKNRIESDCPVFSRCGGCVYRHIDYKTECEIKQNKVYENIKRIGGIDIPAQAIIPADTRYRYRNKAQYPVSDNKNVGFYAVHSHRIIENDNCLLQPEDFRAICNKFTEWLKENNISVYSEENHSGLVRHLYIRKATKTDEIMVVIVINGDTLPHADKLTESLKTTLGEQLKSIQININKKDTNVILGDKCKVLYGGEFITDILCGIKIRISPLSFYQVNRDMAERLYLKAQEYADCKNKSVIDLYCGAGTIGLSLAHTAKQIIGVEIVKEAVEDAKINALINNITNAEFICSDAAVAAKELAEKNIKADVIIVDPPRKGCEESLLKTIANDFSPERLVYVSCDSATLARDIKILYTLGYKLTEYTPVDMFPHTSHVECVALLKRHNNINS